jgi:pyruvate dehydrogenase E1 component alpha subunit
VQSVITTGFTRDYLRNKEIFHIVFHCAVEKQAQRLERKLPRSRSPQFSYSSLAIKTFAQSKSVPGMYHVRSISSASRMPTPHNRKTPRKQGKKIAQSKQRRPETAKSEPSGTSPMNAERLKRLYAAMLKCRFSQDEIRKRLPAHPLCAGLEAVIAGAAIHLKPEDLVAPNTEGDFVQIVRGKTLEEAVHYMKQDESVLMVDEVQQGERTEAELSIAAGMALACKQLNRPLVTLCVARGDHEPDFWRDAVSFCARRQLSIVFVIAQHSGSGHKDLDLRAHAQKFLPAITVDGNDAVAVYRVAEESTRRARQGLGPSLIECRLEAGRDPLFFMESYLRQRNIWSETWKEELERNLRRESQTTATRSPK